MSPPHCPHDTGLYMPHNCLFNIRYIFITVIRTFATSVLSHSPICWDSSQSGTPSLPLWTTDRHGRIVIGNWNIWRPLPLSPPLLASSAHNWCRPGTVTLGCHTKASWLISLWASERVCEELDKPLNTVCWTLKD